MIPKQEICSYREPHRGRTVGKRCDQYTDKGSFYCPAHKAQRLAPILAQKDLRDQQSLYRSLKWGGPISSWSRGKG